MAEDKQLNKKVQSASQMLPSRLNGLAHLRSLICAAALLTSPLLLFN